MLVYRITKPEYAEDLSGTGAALFGGRWNPVGVPLVYTAGSISLACLEYLANNFHLMASTELCLVKIAIADSAPAQSYQPKDLPQDWNETTYSPQSAQTIGSRFVKTGNHYVLKVPSAIVPDEYNVLLNPQHPSHRQSSIVKIIKPFRMDRRLFGV